MHINNCCQWLLEASVNVAIEPGIGGGGRADRVEVCAAAGAVRPAAWVHAVERGGPSLERLDLVVKLHGLLRVRLGLWANQKIRDMYSDGL